MFHAMGIMFFVFEKYGSTALNIEYTTNIEFNNKSIISEKCCCIYSYVSKIIEIKINY